MSRWNFLSADTATKPSSTAAPTAIPNPSSNGASSRLTPDAGLDWRVRTTVRESERVTDLNLYGFRTAGSSNASPEVLKTVLGWLYHNKITVDDAYVTGEQERISEISHQGAELEGQLTQARHQKTELEQTMTREREKLEGKRAELAAVNAGDGSVVEPHALSDRVSFYIAAGILGLLTVYLFLFYVSAIYNAFLFDPLKGAEMGMRTGRELSVTIFNGQAFQQAWASGLMTFAFLASAPSVVIGMGFLIHHFARLGQRWKIGAVLGVTFLFDFLLAYEIVNQIHRLKVLTGETADTWNFFVLVKTAEFYIILLAGFVVYIIWGLILQVVLEGVEKFRPARVAARKLHHAIAACEATCLRLEEEIREAARKVVKLESELKIVEQKRSPRELRNNAFGRHVEELMQGWLTYIAQAFPQERLEKESEAQRVRSETVALLTGAKPSRA